MDRALPVIIVLARDPLVLCRAIQRAFGAGATVRCPKRLPDPGVLASADVVVVDLEDLPNTVAPEPLIDAVESRRLALVVGPEGVRGEWVSCASLPRVRIVPCAATDRDTGFEPVVDALGEMLHRPSGDEVGRLVLRREPYLHQVADLVRAVCQHPWRIRRPRDLAALSSTPMRDLRAVCHGLGFARVEHLIVTVRMVGLEQVMARHRMAPGAARQIVGIADSSNYRRQLERALKGSRQAIRRLRTIAASLAALIGSLAALAS